MKGPLLASAAFLTLLALVLLPVLAQEEPPPGKEAAPPEEQPAPPEEQAAPPEEQAAPPEEQAAVPVGEVAFEVNGRAISLSEFAKELQGEYGDTFRELWITRLLVEEKAKEAGIDVAEGDKQVQTRIDGILKRPQFGGKMEALETALQAQGISISLWRKILRTGYLSEQLINKSREAPEAELLRFFESAYGKGGVKWKIRHILSEVKTQTSDLFTQETYQGELAAIQEKAKASAEAALQRFKGGEDFVSLVLELSDDRVTATEKRKGELGTRWQFLGKEFDTVARATAQGDAGGPIKSSRGYHVIQVTEMAPADFQAQQIMFSMRSLKGLPEEEQAAQTDALRKKADQVLQEALGGKDFAELARTYSEDPGTKARGGDMGVQKSPSRYGPEFDKAIAEMKPGEIRGPIESRVGLHILKLKSKTILPAVRHILFSTQYHQVREKRVRPILEEKATEKMSAVLEALEGGEDFAALVGTHSDDAASKSKAGEIQQYRPELYGQEFHDAVMEMKPGDPPKIIKSRRGVHLAQLMEVTETRFEDVKSELVEQWRKQRPVRPPEIQAWHQKIRKEAAVVIPGEGGEGGQE